MQDLSFGGIGCKLSAFKLWGLGFELSMQGI